MSIIRTLGRIFVNSAPWSETVLRHLYRQLPARLRHNPDDYLRARLSGIQELSFVQIGASDGVNDDLLRSLVLDHSRWKGVLVEPQLDSFNLLKSTYNQELHRCTLVNKAIGTESGSKKLYYLPESEVERLGISDKEWVKKLASFNESHLLRHFPQGKIKSQIVPVITFADAANLLPGGIVDLVALDVEGFEREIIETIDFNRHRVRCIVFEHRHLPPDSDRLVSNLLGTNGFKLKRFDFDTIACR